MTHYRTTEIDGLNIFYREAGDNNLPVMFLRIAFPLLRLCFAI
ncbi:alpha/beta fold hydrolase [Paenibacillus chitinolyticus]